VVGVVNVMPEPGVSSRLGPYTQERARQARLLGEAEQFLDERGVGARLMAPVGGAAGEIVAAARRMGADLIVLGRHGGRTPRVLGSTSGRVMRHAPCDVLVVHDQAVASGPPGSGG
jgi:nucleotide-binding universal stress UspA family protein